MMNAEMIVSTIRCFGLYIADFMTATCWVNTAIVGTVLTTSAVTIAAVDVTESPSIAAFSNDQEPTLTIRSADDKIRSFTRAELLKFPQLTELEVTEDVAYPGRKMKYEAIPVAELFKGTMIQPKMTLTFSCLDGFAAPISVQRLLNTDPTKAVAYLAIETRERKWPPLEGKSGNSSGDRSTKSSDTVSAGPFYIIWSHPEKSKVGPEEWPFQLAGIEIRPPIEEQFPQTVPDGVLAENAPARRGYKAFLKNCFSCHTMNREGASRVGPDLNVPMSPSEYFKPGMIEKLVRDPQNVRHWPQGKMPSFDRKVLSDKELNDIVAYLKHMAKQKPARTDKIKKSIERGQRTASSNETGAPFSFGENH